VSADRILQVSKGDCAPFLRFPIFRPRPFLGAVVNGRLRNDIEENHRPLLPKPMVFVSTSRPMHHVLEISWKSNSYHLRPGSVCVALATSRSNLIGIQILALARGRIRYVEVQTHCTLEAMAIETSRAHALY